jgi:hypothetical protein
VVGTADRQISVFNLSAPQTPYKQIQSPLKFQTRCVTCFPDTTGYLVGSIEVSYSSWPLLLLTVAGPLRNAVQLATWCTCLKSRVVL